MQKISDNIYLLVIFAMIGSALLVVSFILIIIYNSNKLLKQKRKLQEAEISYQKELLYAIINSQEKERQRIGMDLHDEVGSSLSSLRLMIENFIDKASVLPQASQFCNQSKQVIDAVITNVRNISHNLSPLGKGTYEFIDALEDLKDNVNQSPFIFMSIDNQSKHLASLNDVCALALYRVFSELVNNTIKHSKATEIKLSIMENNHQLVFKYKDNGIGIAKNGSTIKSGIGMKNIESRLQMIESVFTLNQTENKGFEIDIILNNLKVV
jgi:signal transduction histidine kinase